MKSYITMFTILILILSILSPTNVFTTNTEINYDPKESYDLPSKMYKKGYYFVHSGETILQSEIIQTFSSIDYDLIYMADNFQTKTQLYPNQMVKLDLSINDNLVPISQSSTSNDIIDVNSAWQLGFNGSNTVIAIVDTGVKTDHPALQNKLIAEKSFHKKQYGFEYDLGPEDIHGHGTSVASAALGYDLSTNYTSPGFGAKLVSARIGLENGYSTTASVVAALDWVISQNEVDIISMSLSEPEEGYSFDPLEQIANIGVGKGKVILTSAGNNGKNDLNFYQLGSPSSSPEVISVGASNDGDVPTSFSSRGPSYDGSAKPDILAPGIDIKVASLNGGYRFSDGTSFSTPIVAGVAAILISALKANQSAINPGLIKSVLCRSVNDLGHLHYTQGFGRINVSKMINLLSNHSLIDLPLVGPDQNHINGINLDLPLNTSISFPITLINLNENNLSISTDYPFVEINYEQKYSGYTDLIIIHLKLIRNYNLSQLNLSINYFNNQNYTNIHYIIDIEIFPEPDFTVLIDLKHTPYDSFFAHPIDERLERIGSDDIEILHDTIRNLNGWLFEMVYEDFSYEFLSKFDILWLPSAFSDPLTDMYDHPVQEIDLTTSEAFAIHEFIVNGGRILLDFDGKSSYSDNYSFFTNTDFLKQLSHLMGVQFNFNNNNLSSSYNSKLSYFVNESVPINFDNIDMSNGFIFSGNNLHTTGLGSYSDKIHSYIHNSRNWRSDGGEFNPNYKYIQNVFDFLNSNIFQYSVNNSSIKIIDINSNIDFGNYNFVLYVNGQQVNFETMLDINSIILNYDFSPHDDLYLTLYNDTMEIFELKYRVPDNIPNIESIYSISDNNKERINILFDKINFLSGNIRMSEIASDQYNLLITPDNELIIEIDANNSFDIKELSLEIIMESGIKHIYELKSQEIVTSTSQLNSSTTSIFSNSTISTSSIISSTESLSQNFVMLPLISVIITLIYRNKKSFNL